MFDAIRNCIAGCEQRDGNINQEARAELAAAWELYEAAKDNCCGLDINLEAALKALDKLTQGE